MSQPTPPPPLRTEDELLVLRMARWLLAIALVVLGFFVLRFAGRVMGPVLASLAIAYLLDPIVEKLVQRGMGRATATTLILGVFLAVVVVVVAALSPRIAHEVQAFVEDLPKLIDTFTGWLSATVGIELPHDWNAYLRSEEVKGMLAGSGGPLREVATAALSGVSTLLAVLADLLLVPVFAFYFLVSWPSMTANAMRLVPPRRRNRVGTILREIDTVVSGWVRGQATVTAILAVLYAAAFSAISMPMGVVIGLVVGLLTVIPFVGTVVGAAIALAITLADGQGLGQLGVVGGIIGVLHVLEAMVLTPKIVGHRVGLSEAAALFAVVAGGKVLGFVGVLLAVPLAATIAVLLRHAVRYYEQTEFFGTEPAPPPIPESMSTIMPAPVELGSNTKDSSKDS